MSQLTPGHANFSYNQAASTLSPRPISRISGRCAIFVHLQERSLLSLATTKKSDCIFPWKMVLHFRIPNKSSLQRKSLKQGARSCIRIDWTTASVGGGQHIASVKKRQPDFQRIIESFSWVTQSVSFPIPLDGCSDGLQILTPQKPGKG